MFYININIYLIMEERLIYSQLPNIESYAFVLGLKFPESATEFQKAVLTLARLYAVVNDYVLKGLDVPLTILELCDNLNTIQYDERGKQR